MKKVLILISLILCLGTSVFAANDELGLYFVFPFNQYESNGNDASGFGGMIMARGFSSFIPNRPFQ